MDRSPSGCTAKRLDPPKRWKGNANLVSKRWKERHFLTTFIFIFLGLTPTISPTIALVPNLNILVATILQVGTSIS
jgi:hypothetical protein